MSVLLLPFLLLAAQAEPAAEPAYEDDPDVLEEVVVTAGPPRGAAISEQPPEVTLDAREVRALGAGSVAELLEALEPQTRSARGRGGERPVVLLNGRRTSGFGEVRSLPPEAIERVEILPEEAALNYGFRPDQRVVNIVLRRRFRSREVEAELGAATRGGRLSHELDLGFLQIDRDRRANLDLEIDGAEALFENERDLVSRSALAGDPVDPRPFRTLSGESRQASVSGAFNRPLGPASATVSVDLDRTEGESFQGPPRADLTVPGTSPFSRSGSDEDVRRFLPGLAPLRRATEGLTGRLGLALNGDLGDDWRWSVTGGADASRTRVSTARDPNVAALQARLDALDPTFDPFGPLSGAGAVFGLPDQARSVSRGADLQAVLNGTPFETSAGNVRTTLRLLGDTRRLESLTFRDADVVETALSRDRGSLQGSLDVPLSSRRRGNGPLGDLNLNLNAEVERYSDFGTLRTLGGGATWSPLERFTVVASYTDEDGAPTIQQLGDPVLATPSVQFFDFVRGESVEAVRIDGGNPGLSADNRRVAKLGLIWKPRVGEDDLSVTADYVVTRVDDPISEFPAITAAVEAAFPERFERDAEGRLVRVDVRPVNFDRLDRSEVRWGVNWSRRLAPPGSTGEGRRGPDAGPPAEGAGAAVPGGFGGGRGFGGGGRGQGRLQLALYHTVRLEDRILIRPGLPELDLLEGQGLGARGGRPRHELDLQAGFNRNGLGARLTGRWQAETALTSGGDELTFSDFATFNLRLFADLGQRREWVRERPWLRGTRLTLNVSNLFDTRQDVRDGSGAVPISYQPDYLDPVGRTVRFGVRKIFLPRRPAPGLRREGNTQPPG